MAAVFALVFLFVVAASGLMFKSMSSGFGTTLIWALFLALAGGVFLGLFRLARQWENEEPTGD